MNEEKAETPSSPVHSAKGEEARTRPDQLFDGNLALKNRLAAGTGASVNEIRKQFLEFYQKSGHEIRKSAPLVPFDDPTLLFVNAGMVPFKNIFTGAERAFAPRAVSAQKCMRAGGKHNDLDNVGYTARHHTFFEMLGNFSFGDYFKAYAIESAWTLITRQFALPVERLCVTVYAEDEEAASLWKKIAGLPEDRIIRIATHDNFWMMGDTGPCGPCSEIFFDHGDKIAGGPPGSADADGDRFVEIWNLVFMQFESHADGTRTALPKPSIDTGMGLERIAAVLQGVHNNYDIDLFANIIRDACELFGREADADHVASFRVIADHLRSSAFLISDGVSPSNEGRGYVLRRIMRRAMRHAHLLGAHEPIMWKLAASLIRQMGGAYPELGRAQSLIESTLREEEGRFQRTLSRGMQLLETEIALVKSRPREPSRAEALASGTGAGHQGTGETGRSDTLSGDVAFKLYDTYGFPLDLTQDILRGQSMSVDLAGYDAAMERQKEAGRGSWTGSGEIATQEDWLALREQFGATRFLGYQDERATGKLLAIIGPAGQIDVMSDAFDVETLFDQTPFYGESGGQAGDHGEIHFGDGVIFDVVDTQKRAGDLHVHRGRLRHGAVRRGVEATLLVQSQRRSQLRRAHSATHLMNASLRNILGSHVAQKGSLVEADRLRFDFSHPQPVSISELLAVEDAVNAQIWANQPAFVEHMELDAAIASGAVAMFGEKYSQEVRVLSMGSVLDEPSMAANEAGKPQSVFSKELCGGTHVQRTGDIGLFVITSESGVSAGIRRVEALTGAAAFAHLRQQIHYARQAADSLKAPLPELAQRVEALQLAKRNAEQALSDARKKLAMMGPSDKEAGSKIVQIGNISFFGQIVDAINPKDLRGLVDNARTEMGSGVALFIARNEGKAAIAAGITPDLLPRISAVNIVQAVSTALGGSGGGGRPDFAQGGAPDAMRSAEGLTAARNLLEAIGQQ